MTMTQMSTRTINRNRKIEILRESMLICMDLLLMEKRNIEAGNMSHYKKLLNELKEIKKQADSYGKPINQEKEILSND
jgi:hypothetical protein